MATQNKERRYPMDANPIGHCLIINNVEFTGGNLAERVGSDQDATKLEELFGNFLNFTVELKRNVTREQFETTLQHYQEKDHSEFCTFFVIILSHGDEGNIVYASDGQSIKLDDIFKHFSAGNCPSLGGKPKVFIVQACRGDQHNNLTSPDRQDGTYHVSQDPKIPQGYCIIINNNTQKYNDENIKKMREVFSDQLGFHVQVYSSLTRKGIKHLLKTVATVDHSEQYCFVLIVLSKGEREKVIYGSDGKKLGVNDLVMLFSRNACSSLEEKPKLFFTETQLNEPNDVQPEFTDVPHTFIASYFGSFPVERKPILTLITSLSIQFTIQESLAAFASANDPTFTMKDVLANPLHFWDLTPRDTDKEKQCDAKLRLALSVLSKLRKATVEKLEKDQQKIFSICQNVRQSRIAGSITSLVGGGLAVIGIGLIPVTFGGSIALSVIGAGVGVAGGAVTIASTVTDKRVSELKLKQAKAILNVDIQLTEQVNEILLQRFVDKAIRDNPATSREEAVAVVLQGRQLLRTIAVTANAVTSGVQVARSAIHGGAFALRVTGAAARGVAIVGGVVTVLTVPLDLGELIYNSVKLYNRSETKATTWFDGQIIFLNDTQKKIENMANDIDEHSALEERCISLEGDHEV
ncbi:PREDICTED: uncharacterized protein LOC109581823 [Amphimedon queenslandica]|uniref:Caspase family p20 domain-containing protein n=2 Tax=Amphimedon queenslandica TaxID=400682 RepID=A0AAN0J4Y3_AMPQE|nr:PREDICTED: uncharacterized protein LOC109581823 [Amphimedon queenslandica]|eukprot:XP_019851802.1 PREDICTED: uncharacterized protein LOC109581823 [Amphimedon queenslandica]